MFKALRVSITLVSILWVFHIIQFFQGVRWVGLGVFPRTLEGSIGILTCPFIHGDFNHLLSNSVPMLILITLMYIAYSKSANAALFLIYFLTGLGMWLFARSHYHIGASGVVYGLVTFLFWTGIFRRSPRSIVISLIIIFAYSGYFYGIFPTQPGVSWDGHLIGAIVGIIVAYILRNRLERENQSSYSYEKEEEDETYFLPRDVFDE